MRDEYKKSWEVWDEEDDDIYHNEEYREELVDSGAMDSADAGFYEGYNNA